MRSKAQNLHASCSRCFLPPNAFETPELNFDFGQFDDFIFRIFIFLWLLEQRWSRQVVKSVNNSPGPWRMACGINRLLSLPLVSGPRGLQRDCKKTRRLSPFRFLLSPFVAFWLVSNAIKWCQIQPRSPAVLGSPSASFWTQTQANTNGNIFPAQNQWGDSLQFPIRGRRQRRQPLNIRIFQ